MNTYVFPISNPEGEIWIDSVCARSMSEAQEKVMERFIEQYELDFTDSSWEEFASDAKNHEFLIGDLEDIETI